MNVVESGQHDVLEDNNPEINKIVYLQRVAIFQDLNMGLRLMLRSHLILKIYDVLLCSRQSITDLLIGAKTFNDSVLDSNGFKRISVKIKKKKLRSSLSLFPPRPSSSP